MRDYDRNVGRHSRFQPQIRVVDFDDSVVSHNVLHCDRRVPYLRNSSVKNPRWKSIHRKIDLLVNRDHADISLRHVRVDLHLCQVIRDHENDGRLQTCGDCLADIDIP